MQPLYCTALGKALLSGMTDEAVRSSPPVRWAGRNREPAHAPYAIADVDRLLEQIVERSAEMATPCRIFWEEKRTQTRQSCVAVPLCSGGGRLVYAMSVSAPSFRMEETELRRCVEMLTSVRQKLEPYLQTV
ncbi:MAG: IclR family transcriptional regulator C-terminal domain-containing protein [Lachnospiraceae bacterium]